MRSMKLPYAAAVRKSCIFTGSQPLLFLIVVFLGIIDNVVVFVCDPIGDRRRESKNIAG